MPATEIEHELEGEEPLVFRTDLNGVITYADGHFIKAGGFCAGELYGKSHHMVRHPDVPSVIFMELWSTVTSGKAWTGTVKSRCKDGRFYWAHATVTPVRAGGKITGCIFMYRKPTPSEIGEASRRYQCMSEGKEAVPGLTDILAGLSRQESRVLGPSLASIVAVLLTASGVGGLYFSGIRNIFLALAAAGLGLAAWAVFLLARARAHSFNTVTNSAAVLAFAGLSACREAACGPAGGKGDLPQQPGGAAPEENIPGANGQARLLVRKANDIAITRVRKTKGSVALGGEAGKAVEGIVVAVRRVSGIMAEISAVPAGQSMAAGQYAAMKGKPAAAAGFVPDKSGKLVKGCKAASSAEKRSVTSRTQRARKQEEDEWKDF